MTSLDDINRYRDNQRSEFYIRFQHTAPGFGSVHWKVAGDKGRDNESDDAQSQ